MSRSIFDPTGPNTERTGNMFLPPDANQISNLPEEIVDGKVAPDEELAAGLSGKKEDVVHRLEEMSKTEEEPNEEKSAEELENDAEESKEGD